MRERKTIWVDVEVWERLRKLKVHEREPFNDVIKRLLEFYERHREKQ